VLPVGAGADVFQEHGEVRLYVSVTRVDGSAVYFDDELLIQVDQFW
jgi:hypothetical protein